MGITETQAAFAFFFAVLYAAMLTGLAGLQPFPWGFGAEPTPHRWRLLWRLVVATLLLNLLPLMLFAYGYLALSHYKTELTFWLIVLAGLSGMAVFAPYRLYHVLIVLTRGSAIALYDEGVGRDDSEEVSRRLRAIRKWPSGHILACVFYLLPFLLLLFLATGSPFPRI